MLQMDSQFNTLVRSYHDNYLQHKITGDSKYQTSYSAAERGLQNIICAMNKDVDDQKKQISQFYKPNVDEQISLKKQQHKQAQLSLISEHDIEETSRERNDQLNNFSLSVPAPSMLGQYIGLGVLGVTTLALLFL